MTNRAERISYVGVTVVAISRPRLVEHGYDWFIILIELNILLTIAGVIAWIRDLLYERNLDLKQITSR